MKWFDRLVKRIMAEEIATLRAEIEEKATYEEIENQCQAVVEEVKDLQSDFQNLDSVSRDDMEEADSDLDNKISDLASRIEDAEDIISDFKDDISDLSSRIEDLEEKINNLQDGSETDSVLIKEIKETLTLHDAAILRLRAITLPPKV